MSDAGREPPDRAHSLVPTLTEVIEPWESGGVPLDEPRSEAALMSESLRGRWPAPLMPDDAAPAAPAAPAARAAPASQASQAAQAAAAPLPALNALNEDQIVQRVLLDLQRQIDLMLEYRVREALRPALTRATDALVMEARNELASTLHSIVAKSVAQELARHRKL